MWGRSLRLVAGWGAVCAAIAFTPGPALAARSTSTTLDCVYKGKTVWSISVPASATPAPTLQLTPKSQITKPAAYGKICTLGPANLSMSSAALMSSPASGNDVSAAFVGGGWVELPFLRERPNDGNMVTHAGQIGFVPVAGAKGQYGAPALGTPPPPVTTGNGTLAYTVRHLTDQGPANQAGIGDVVTATVTTSENGTWDCSGENQVPGGISDISTEPSLGAKPTIAPTTVANATVTASGTGVQWQTIAPTGSCSNGNGSPDGLLPPGAYTASYKLGAGAAELPGEFAWSSIRASIQNEAGGGLDSRAFAPLDCTCTLSVSPTALTSGATVTVSGTHWKDGTVNIVLGDVLVASTKATGTGSFSAQFTVPAILAPPGAQVEHPKLYAVGPGNHDLEQDVTIN